MTMLVQTDAIAKGILAMLSDQDIRRLQAGMFPAKLETILRRQFRQRYIEERSRYFETIWSDPSPLTEPQIRDLRIWYDEQTEQEADQFAAQHTVAVVHECLRIMAERGAMIT